MLLFDLTAVGNKLLSIRKHLGLTQAEVAELAGLSDRTYADIERGTVNMRVETLLRICRAFCITPDEVLTTENTAFATRQDELFSKLNTFPTKERKTAFGLLSVYLNSLDEHSDGKKD